MGLVQFTDDKTNLCNKWLMIDYQRLNDDMFLSSWDYGDTEVNKCQKVPLKKVNTTPGDIPKIRFASSTYRIILSDVRTSFGTLGLVVA